VERVDLDLGRYLEGQRLVMGRLIDANSLEEAAEDFLATVTGLMGWDAGALWEAVEDEGVLRFVQGWSVPGFDADPLWLASRELRFEPGVGMPGRVWASGRAERAPELKGGRGQYPRLDVARDLGLAATQTIPITTGPGQPVMAVAEFHTREPDERPEQLAELLETFAVQLAAFLLRRRADVRAREVEADAERLRSHFSEVVAGSLDAVISKDLNGFVTSWNPAAERLYGYTAAEAIGRHISFIVPPDHENEEQRILDLIKAGERLETYETDRIRNDGGRLAVSLTISPIRGSGGLVGASVIARDVTSEKRRSRAKDFLLEASRHLGGSLDLDRTARTIVETAVPELAEICVLDLLRPDGRFGDSVVAGVDPEAARRLEAIRRAAPLDPNSAHPVAQVMRAGRPMVWRDLTSPGVIEDVTQSEEHRRLIVDAGYNSAAVVGLVARGRTLGALSFLHARGDERYDPGDLDFLAELGARAALVLDNARLYGERDEIARNLQRGLRPPQPAPVSGLEISVVFEPAGEGIEIGGDVYDVLPTADGCWVLVGDVAGKGSAAAGVSVALRHAVRGLVREIDDPADVLARVNELLLSGESLNDFATAVLARLRRADGRWRLSLACAGHPPAVLLRGGREEELGGGGVLGGWALARVARHDAELEPGETLVLSTDGWFEAGPVASHAGPGALAASARELAGGELGALTAGLAADAIRRAGGELRDDLIVLALRPEAEPVGAGPGPERG
jgi:PAS domain S-box-containing protein